MTSPETYPAYDPDFIQASPERRDALILSIGPNGVLSRYADAIWDFDPYFRTLNVPRCARSIDFRLPLSDAACITDVQFTDLLASVRAFLYARLAHRHPVTGRPVCHRTVIGDWARLRPLLRWMVAQGHRRFADLTPRHCRAYAESVKAERTAHGALRPGTLRMRLGTIGILYAYRFHLIDAPLQNPWPHDSAGSLTGRRDIGPGDTEQIPDRLLRLLVRGALRYLSSGYGEQLLACRDARLAGADVADRVEQLGLDNWRAVKEEVSLLRTACYVVIALFSGLRDSELASLEIGCYREREGWDGAVYGWIRGLTYKLEVEPRAVEWMVPPIVAGAVRLAERASAPLRAELTARIETLEARLASAAYLSAEHRAADVTVLHKARQHRASLFLGLSTSQKNSIHTLSAHAAGDRLKRFATALELRVEPQDLARVKNRDRIPVGDIWPLAAHQFRKTFAVYAARNVLGDVRYLREHFKHWSLDMTLYYTVAELDALDENLFDEVMSERNELQALLVEDWIQPSTPLAGVGGERLKQLRQRGEAHVAKDHHDLARQLATGFYIRGTGHSWCTSENCKGLGLYNVLECRDCGNRIIDRSHLLVWRGIRDQQIELLQLDDLGDPIWQRAVDHLRYAEQILRDLGDPVSAHPIPPQPSERRRIGRGLDQPSGGH